jgi:hypothetical protein
MSSACHSLYHSLTYPPTLSGIGGVENVPAFIEKVKRKEVT